MNVNLVFNFTFQSVAPVKRSSPASSFSLFLVTNSEIALFSRLKSFPESYKHIKKRKGSVPYKSKVPQKAENFLMGTIII